MVCFGLLSLYDLQSRPWGLAHSQDGGFLRGRLGMAEAQESSMLQVVEGMLEVGQMQYVSCRFPVSVSLAC